MFFVVKVESVEAAMSEVLVAAVAAVQSYVRSGATLTAAAGAYKYHLAAFVPSHAAALIPASVAGVTIRSVGLAWPFLCADSAHGAANVHRRFKRGSLDGPQEPLKASGVSRGKLDIALSDLGRRSRRRI